MDSRLEKDLLVESIERYLRRLESHLYGADPQTIADTLEEIRQHLTAGCEELMRNGYSGDQAIRLTLKRFGRTDKVGQNLARQMSPRSAQFKVYSVLMVGRYVKFIAVCLAAQDSFGLAQSWSERLGGAIAAILLVTLLRIVEEARRSAIQPAFIAKQVLRKNEMERELSRLGIGGALSAIKASSYLSLSFLLLIGIGCIRAHIYAMAVYFFVEAVERIYIKITAKRISANMAA